MTNQERDEKLAFVLRVFASKCLPLSSALSQIKQLFSEGKDKKRDICVHFDGGTCGNPAIPEVGELTERYCNECAFYEGKDKEVEEAIEIARTVDNWDFGEPATDIKWAVKTLIDAVERKI